MSHATKSNRTPDGAPPALCSGELVRRVVTLNVEPDASADTLHALVEMAKLVACRDCWRCHSAVEMPPREFVERCPHCNAYDPHGSPQPNKADMTTCKKAE